jgi:hypothetical protein
MVLARPVAATRSALADDQPQIVPLLGALNLGRPSVEGPRAICSIRSARMSIKGKSPEDLVKLAEASGSIVLDCNGYTIEDLIEITRALKTARTLTILNAGGKNTTDLLRLAAEAPGQVIFS